MKRIGNNEIQDNEIRILGSGTLDSPEHGKKGRTPKWVWVVVASALLLAVGLLALIGNLYINGYFNFQKFTPTRDIEPITLLKDNSQPAYVTVVDTLVGDSKLRIFYPHNAMPALHVGPLDAADTDVVSATQAAVIRGDNDQILGSFVMDGEKLARGNTVKGFCAVIGNQISIGYSKNTALVDQAVDSDGHFFRQYCLVAEGMPVYNNQERKFIRRALCTREGRVFIVETLTSTSMSDFSHTLIDMGVEYAVNLVGTKTYGWYTDRNGTRHEFTSRPNKVPENTSYLVWR